MKPGTRIELVHTTDPQPGIEPGDQGVVTFVDDLGTIHVKWANGLTLGLVPGQGAFRVVADDGVKRGQG